MAKAREPGISRSAQIAGGKRATQQSLRNKRSRWPVGVAKARPVLGQFSLRQRRVATLDANARAPKVFADLKELRESGAARLTLNRAHHVPRNDFAFFRSSARGSGGNRVNFESMTIAEHTVCNDRLRSSAQDHCCRSKGRCGRHRSKRAYEQNVRKHGL